MTISEQEGPNELRQRLLAAVGSVCPPWLADQRDDLVQLSMMAVLRQQEKEGGARRMPTSYLRKVAYTTMVDEIRRLRSRHEVALEDDESQHDAPPVAEEADPERQFLSREISAAVRRCLELLPPPRRNAVTLQLLAYKVPEIARRMGWKRKQAENLVFRGKQDLRECLRGQGFQP